MTFSFRIRKKLSFLWTIGVTVASERQLMVYVGIMWSKMVLQASVGFYNMRLGYEVFSSSKNKKK